MDLGRDLKDKRVLITGASSGLGAHFARLCACCGAHVAIAARRLDRLKILAEELRGLGAPTAVPIALDVSDAAAIHAARAQAVDGLGGLDILVNNAGIAREGLAMNQTAEEFDAVMDVNLRGVWLMAISCGRHWRETGTPGVIINIASVLGLGVAAGVASYAVSKAGVVQMTKALALEFARHNIRVNALAPGYFQTEINEGFFETEAGRRTIERVPMRRIGRLEDLDGPFLLLATDASRFMTGAIVPVDGGHLVAPL
ncbi:SDR family NAD(P)-dependent oxidoreductase [Polymorphum gilvum]|uniref:Short-chain dehydrogenase/reductase SDR n=1 Tax=Polymorphum gilvum (strain LMG 25793 / CGMCC 1.9160 / SL003B-26A1) TaxID=991905 RepID=F2J6U2_POLGS|nr:SDR family oxidoreductase [Polymorphum gilvum]ADZ72575.1 Short-chain dehydrogenase/reductase SDR [Polymorphum gilvum SL003B-26A1]